LITHNEIEVLSIDEESFSAFIGASEGTTSVIKNRDKYDDNVYQISIKNFSRNDSLGKVRKVPAVDFHSKRIFIKWVDSLEVLTKEGSSKTFDRVKEDIHKNEKNSKELSYKNVAINIAVINPINNIRISVLSWGYMFEKKWKFEYFNQFPESDKYLYFLNVPIIDRRTIEVVHFDNIKPFSPPTILTSATDVEVGFTQLMSQETFKSLYKKFSKEDGYYYKYDDDDFELIDKIVINNGIKDKGKSDQVLNSSYGLTDARKMTAKFRELQNQIDFSKTDTIKDDTIFLKDREEYFRYPPIHESFGASLFIDFEKVKFVDCYGFIQVGDKKYAVDNQLLEIEHLTKAKLEYPSLFMNLGQDGKQFTIRGLGVVKVDGEVIKANFYENRFIILCS